MPLLCFASPKGGVGKTTLSANVASLLAQQGLRVLAMDFDPQNALRLHFGVPLDHEAGFMVGLMRGQRWQDALVETESGVLLLPHGTMDFRGALALSQDLENEPERLSVPLREILSDPELVVVADTPPGSSAALSVLISMADTIVIVLLADAASAALIPSVTPSQLFGRGTLGESRSRRFQVVLNQVELDDSLSSAVLDCAEEALGWRLTGAVARDRALPRALANRSLLMDAAPDALAMEDLRGLADGLLAMLPVARSHPAPTSNPAPGLVS